MPLNDFLTSIADVIRDKKQSTDLIRAVDFPAEINSIEASAEPKLQEKSITENGTFTPDEGYDGFSKVSVNVESGGSGDKLTLFTPTISLQSVTSVLTITDENGGFVQGYNLYANDELVTTLTSKTETLNDYIEHTETLNIKVQAVGENFNDSEFSNVVIWKYNNTAGTTGLLYTDKGSYAICYGLGDAIETDITIAEYYNNKPVTTIQANAFQNCNTLTSITIPDTVTTIYYGAFKYCSNLTSITLSSKLTTITQDMLAECSSLASLVIPSSVTKIEESAFSKCKSLTSLVIPNSVTNIGNTCFYMCTNLEECDFSKHTSIPTLGSGAFGYCDKVKIKVPASLIDEWKSATNWSNYASKIVTEFTNEV